MHFGNIIERSTSTLCAVACNQSSEQINQNPAQLSDLHADKKMFINGLKTASHPLGISIPLFDSTTFPRANTFLQNPRSLKSVLSSATNNTCLCLLSCQNNSNTNFFFILLSIFSSVSLLSLYLSHTHTHTRFLYKNNNLRCFSITAIFFFEYKLFLTIQQKKSFY